MPRRVMKTAVHRSGHGQVSIILTAPPPTLAELKAAAGKPTIPKRTSVLNVQHVSLPPLSRISKPELSGYNGMNKFFAPPLEQQTLLRASTLPPRRRLKKQASQSHAPPQVYDECPGTNVTYVDLQNEMGDAIDDVIEATLNENTYADDDAPQQFVDADLNGEANDAGEPQRYENQQLSPMLDENDDDVGYVGGYTGDAGAAENVDEPADEPVAVDDPGCTPVKEKRDTSNHALRYKRHATLCFFKTGDKPQVIQKKLKMVYGKDAPSKNAVYRWIAQFREGNEDIEFGFRGGSRVTEKTQKFAGLIKSYIELHREATVRQIGVHFGLAPSSVHEILKNRIHYRKRGNKWTSFEAKETKKASGKRAYTSSGRTAKRPEQPADSTQPRVNHLSAATAQGEAGENVEVQFAPDESESENDPQSLYASMSHEVARTAHHRSENRLLNEQHLNSADDAATLYAVGRHGDAQFNSSAGPLRLGDQYRYRLVGMQVADATGIGDQQMIFVTSDGNEAVDITQK